MSGYFQIGEQTIRPGGYFNVQKKGDEDEFGAVDGIVAVLFKASLGPLGTATVIDREDGYAQTYGTDGTTDAIREAIYGGAKTVIACRVGTGGSVSKLSLDAGTGKVSIEAKYPGKADFSATIRTKLADSSRKECVIYNGTDKFETINFDVGTNEVDSLIAACNKSKHFTAKKEGEATGVITDVNQSKFTGGADPTATAADYSAAFTEIEKHYFNSICVDTEDKEILELVKAFLDRIYLTGQFGIGVVAEKSSLDLEERMETAISLDSENMVYVLNPSAKAGELNLDSYQTAALVAGMVASIPSSRTLTNTEIERYTAIREPLTPTQYIKAIKKGCLALSYNSHNKVRIDNGVNTLLTLDKDHDAGWKKIRRVRTRYELMYRVNAQVDEISSKVDCDTNGKATILGKIQGICNKMIEEGKLIAATVKLLEQYDEPDACFYEIDVIDKDSAERIHVIYKYRFSTKEE